MAEIKPEPEKRKVEAWMREAVRELRGYPKDVTGISPEALAYYEARETADAQIIADHAPSEREAFEKWISVNERLPEFSGTYIVAVNGPGDDGEAHIGTLPADWNTGDKHWHDLRGWGHSEVTHWMPLPTAPGAAKREK